MQVPIRPSGDETLNEESEAIQAGLAMLDTRTGAYHEASLPEQTRCLTGDPPRLCGHSSSGLLLVYHTSEVSAEYKEAEANTCFFKDRPASVSVFSQDARCMSCMPVPLEQVEGEYQNKDVHVAGWSPLRDEVLFSASLACGCGTCLAALSSTWTWMVSGSTGRCTHLTAAQSCATTTGSSAWYFCKPRTSYRPSRLRQ